MTERRLIEEFGLQRTDENAQYIWDIIGLRLLLPFTGPIDEDTWEQEWPSRRIVSAEQDSADDDFLRYAYHSDHKACVIYEASLEQELEGRRSIRRTNKCLWQMVQDNWLASGNPADSLRYLMFATIVNTTVQESIHAEFDYQLTQDQGQRPWGTRQTNILTTTPDNSMTWGLNPFIRSGVHLATSLSTADRTLTCEKAHLIKRYDGVSMYMVLEFKNGDSGQQNYIDYITQLAEPMVAANIEQMEKARAAGLPWEGEVFSPLPTSDDT